VTWVVRGGPGVKIDEVKRVVTVDDLGNPLIIPAETETSFGLVGKSKFAWALNDKVELSNITDILYASESTQISNGLALTAQINGSLSARFGFDTRYDTNPPDGFESTDTATKIGVVYKFGAH
jgi:putative salt-induced outer membrane protein